MEADTTAEQCREAESLAMTDPEVQSPRPAHSLLDALLPANPPQPKNARMIRLFDYEGARDDAPPAAAQVLPRIPTPREAAKAARRLSLFAAAGLD